MSKPSTIPVAVVGVGALFPSSDTARGFWRNILDGVDLIDDVPEGRWRVDDYYDPDPTVPDKTYARRGGFLDKTAFDPMKYGVPPNIVEATDTSQLLALIVAQQVLDDAAGGQFSDLDRDKISVVLGVTSGQELMTEMASRLQRPVWQKSLREAGLEENKVQEACDRISSHYVDWQEGTFPGLLGNVVAGRIANRFDLGGTNAVTDAACASTLSALSMGLSELYLGHSDVVIAGGVDTFNDIFMYMCFSKTPALSQSGDCRPFSDQADGTMLGEGLAMFALKRLDDAERDDDEVYAIIRGIGSSSDGRSKSIYAPLSEGQAKALRRTYEYAGYGPETVELLEAHGTGTKAGDLAEFGGLRQVFEESGRDDKQWCALGSVKSQVGHTKAAAGAAGLFKVVMSLHHKVLPPTLKVERPNPKLEVHDTPFYLNTERRPWIRASDHPRRGSVSAFGFGGSNFHVTLEEYTGPKPKPRFRHTVSELVVLDADSAEQLADSAEMLAEQAEERPLERIANETQLDFSGREHRLAIVAESVEDLRRKLSQASDSVRSATDGFALPNGLYYGCGKHDGKLAFIFPGQGSQYLGMGSELAEEFDAARAVWDRAADVELDTPLHQIVFPPPAFTDEEREEQAARLRRTDFAQPALGAASLATLGVLRSLGIEPDAVGGHSFGEITALYAANVIDEDAAIRIARRRGELMADAARSTTGAMCAVALSGEKVEQRLKDWGCDIVIANYNSPRQTVLSGTLEAIADVEKRFEADSIGCTRLNVATAFHSSIVADSTEPFSSFLKEIDLSDRTCDVWANATGTLYEDDEDATRQTLASQIARPVRFESMVRGIVESGVTTFVEVGPGTVLTRLVRRIAEDDVVCISTDAKERDGLTALWHALGQLVTRGITPQFDALWKDRAVNEAAPQKPGFSIDIWGGNHNRPYPPTDGALPGPNPPTQVATPAPQTTERPAQRSREVMSNHDDQQHAQPTVSPAAQPSQPRQQTPQTGGGRAADPAWVHAFQDSQRQMANAHAAYQNAMAQTHTAFLNAVAASQSNLTAMLTGVAPDPARIQAPVAPAPSAPAPAPQQQYAHQPVQQQPVQQQPVQQQPVQHSQKQPVHHSQQQTVARPAAAPASGGNVDLQSLLLEVVAEKTGYPVEMLELEMKLEADLGIDSIKRVEILSAVQEAAPGLPDVDGTEMAQLGTLREIVEFLQDVDGEEPSTATSPAATSPAAASPAAASPASVTPTPMPQRAEPGADLETVLLDAVADKTGYPKEMLELDMKLEADLGVDSIKRVEILSSVNEALPELPEVDGSEMASLGTLREILDFMQSSLFEKKNSRATA